MAQLQVRGAGPSTVCVDVQLGDSVHMLKALIEGRTGIPCDHQGLVFGGRQLQDDEALWGYQISSGSTIQLVYRLLGGKGGFGALLRGAARDGKGTTNFDACRDLSGRRIRHQTAELKLAEWRAEAPQRALEKVAMQHIKDQARQKKKEMKEEVDVESVRQAQEDTIARTQEAVQDVLKGIAASSSAAGPSGTAGANGSAGASALPSGAAAAVGQKRGSSQGASVPMVKRSKMMAALEDVSGSDSEDSQ